MMMQREENALKAYLNLMERKGVSEVQLIQRHFILVRLMPYLEDIPLDGKHYRSAVDQLFKESDKAEWAISIPVIRDYFCFWVNDIKAIAALSQDHAFDGKAKQWRPEPVDVKAFWESLDSTALTQAEVQPLEFYENTLRNRGADDLFIDTRKKLAKLLLLKLRSVPHKQPSVYRKVIDATLPLFTMEETHHTFLNVSREFYYFWRGDAKASSSVANEALMAA